MSRAKTTCTLSPTLFEFSCLKKQKNRCSRQVDGLCQRLAHEYDTIADVLVLDAVRKAQDLFPRYVAAVEGYLKKIDAG